MFAYQRVSFTDISDFHISFQGRNPSDIITKMRGGISFDFVCHLVQATLILFDVISC